MWSNIEYYEGYRIIPDVPGGTFGADFAFDIGEIGYWEKTNSFYEAVIDSVVWTPEAYLQAWNLINKPI